MKVGDLVTARRPRWLRSGIVISAKNGNASPNRILVVWPSGLKGWYRKECLEVVSEGR